MKRALFLDRDGVINKPLIKEGLPYPPADLGRFEYVDGVKDLVNYAKKKGFVLCVVTNQVDIARGKTMMAAVEAMHEKIQEDLGIDKIFMCPHDDVDHCACRKPKAGMFFQAASEFDLDLASSIMIGDRWRDVDAAHEAGCTSIFIDYHLKEELRKKPDHIVSSLKQCMDIF